MFTVWFYLEFALLPVNILVCIGCRNRLSCNVNIHDLWEVDCLFCSLLLRVLKLSRPSIDAIVKSPVKMSYTKKLSQKTNCLS